MESNVLFSEHQHWSFVPFLILVVVNAIVITSFRRKGAYKKQPEQKRKLNLSHAVTAFILLLSITFAFFRLDTKISTGCISVRFFPTQLHYKHYEWNTIDSVFVTTYAPLREFNGWGIRGNEHNKAYNMSGDQGIRLVFKNGSRLLIGTNHPIEAKEALQKAGKLNN